MRTVKWARRFLVSASSALVVLASLQFGILPNTAAHVMPQTANSLPPGTVVHAASCEQAPPQSVKDRATYSDAELARYGLPPRNAGLPLDKWAKVVRNARERVCDYTIGAPVTVPGAIPPAQMYKNVFWGGNFADESVSGQNYTEADMDYYVPCVTGTPPGNELAGMSTWIGLGGSMFASQPSMIQVGATAYQSHEFLLYQSFVENTGGTDVGQHKLFPLNCGDHLFVMVWGGNCMYLDRLNDGKNTGDQCYGPPNDGQSAEAIAERSHFESYFADFGTVTFYGVGLRDNGSYLGMNQVPHDYNNVYDCNHWVSGDNCTLFSNTRLAYVGPINPDPGDKPYDEYAVTWQGYGSPLP